jgi:hypothetical protein
LFIAPLRACSKLQREEESVDVVTGDDVSPRPPPLVAAEVVDICCETDVTVVDDVGALIPHDVPLKGKRGGG